MCSQSLSPVSYTHLDVYKRQLLVGDKGIRGLVIGIGKGLSEIEVTEAVAQQSTAQDLSLIHI